MSRFIAFLLLIHYAAAATAEKILDEAAQGVGFGGILRAVEIDPGGGSLLGLGKSLQVAAQAVYPEYRQDGLARAEKIAVAPQAQVLLCDLKAVGGLAEGF